MTGDQQPWVANILHSIGYGFDDNRQPDYQALLANGGRPTATEETKNKIRERYRKVFDMVFACMKDKECSELYMGLVGAGVFAGRYDESFYETMMGYEEAAAASSRVFRNEVWIPAFNESRDNAGVNTENVKILGDTDIPGYENAGFFPHEVVPDSAEESGRRLYVNAWDPHSMVGNGNASDRSLDGFVGRCTASALLSWPVSNNRITYFPVE
jgi:hypothetical protein